MINRVIAVCVAIVASVLVQSSSLLAHDMAGMDMDDERHLDGGSVGAMTEVNPHDAHLGHESMKNMNLHMMWSAPRPATAADQHRADELVQILRNALAKYKDYRVAEDEGFKPFHPEFKQQKIVHFTKWSYGLKAAFMFDPAEPTSLLYKRTPDGGYELIGAMYTAPKRWSEDKLDSRVPLSIARWHKHIDICLPVKGTDPKGVDWKSFGPGGSIATKAACDQAGGVFHPALFGWMVHVYPWEEDQQQVWAH